MLSTLSDTLYTFGIFGLMIVVFSFIGGFLNREKDWRVVWTLYSTQEMESICQFTFDRFNYELPIVWEILYSQSRQKYKIKITTRVPNPKEHEDYKLAIDKLNEFYGKQDC